MKFRLHMGIAALAFVVSALFAVVPQAQAKEYTFTIHLNDKQETPPNDTEGYGSGLLNYEGMTHKFSWSINYRGLTGDAVAAHFHGPAAPGTAAPPVIPIDGNLKSPIAGSMILTDDQAKQLLAGQWYFNVHTAANKAGEIRGQVQPTD